MNTKPTAANTLIVFALEVETQGMFGDLPHIHCGIGKVNAAMHLVQSITEWRQRNGTNPALVLNLGSAGSPYFKAGSLINCTQFIQRDFDVTALGFPPYATPFEDIPATLVNGQRYATYAEGICGTGDSFVTSGEIAPWNAVDMEAYALAKVCLLAGIPFGCVKYITDGADGSAATSWEAGLKDTATALLGAFKQILA